MKHSVNEGLSVTGILEGGLHENARRNFFIISGILMRARRRGKTGLSAHMLSRSANKMPPPVQS
ncbi:MULTISPECIES: hypothetical protein [Paenibacillus]|uniref:Uncharacterized protein n=1 Tax=Paenibacillus polymyxa TaxID=1406 RepID=A0AAP4A1K9_PAEPO|nr:MULTISPECIES: hypothetical protein [Paenibacillus]MDH2333204.1 hypothetical protein [Paenibacillus polymyxa]